MSWPNPLLAELLRSTYPTLVAHHDRVLKKLYPSGWSAVERVTEPAKPTFVESVRLTLPAWLGGPAPETTKPEPVSDDPREKDVKKRLRKGRYLWFLGATAAFISYILLSGIVEFQFGDEGFEEMEWEEGYLGEDGQDPFAQYVGEDDE